MGTTLPSLSLTITRSVAIASFVSMKTTDVWSNGSVRTPLRSMNDLIVTFTLMSVIKDRGEMRGR